MEQTMETQTPSGKIFKDREIHVGTFLGGPLVAGYYIAENFKTFKQPEKAKRTWIIAIIVTVVIFGGIFLIPNIDKIPNQLIPLIYTGLAILFVKQFQHENIKNHLEAGGQVHSWGRTILVSLIGLIIIIIIIPILGIAYFSDTAANIATTTKSYGVMKHEIAFDKNNISTVEIDKIADGFRQTTFFDESQQKFVYAKKLGDTYELSISCNISVKSNPEAAEPFVQLQKNMRRLFPYNKIILNLVVDNLDNVVRRIE